MDGYGRQNAIMAAMAFGIFGCLSIYMVQYSDHPTESACLGIACLAVTSFIVGYVNGWR